MADQNITALPVTTAPETSDQLLIVGATEEKLIDYEKLADAILTKLTSKTFALNQGTMTLLQALNELNSNLQAGLSELVTVPANSVLKINITFKKPFSKIPTVLCCIRSGTEMYKYGNVSAFVDFYSVTTTGFAIKVANSSDSDVSPNVSWIAVI